MHKLKVRQIAGESGEVKRATVLRVPRYGGLTSGQVGGRVLRYRRIGGARWQTNFRTTCAIKGALFFSCSYEFAKIQRR
jgi:hypothetical protein